MPISETTVKTYTSALNALARNLGYDTSLMYPEGWHWLKNHKRVWNVIQLSESPHTMNTKLFAIKYILELNDDAPTELLLHYEDYISVVKEKISEIYAKNRKSVKQEENWLSKQELDDILNALEKKVKRSFDNRKDYKNVMKYLILKIHLQTPFRNNLSEAKIYMDPSKEDLADHKYNYIVLDSSDNSAVFIDNNYKTKSKYGQRTIIWSDEIAKELIHYYHDIIAFNKEHYFLTNNNDEKMTPNNYTKFLESIFTETGKKVSSTMLRNIVVSDLYALDKEDEAKKDLLAHNMGHSRNTAQKIYAKI
jgi:integrase